MINGSAGTGAKPIIMCARSRAWSYNGRGNSIIMEIKEFLDRGEPQHRFKVIWQKHNGEVQENEVDAHDFADAAFRVAESTFDTFHPSGRQLLDVVQLR